MSTPLAVSLGANLILGVYLLVASVGIVFGFFTFRGSGINNHPCDGYHAPPGSRLPDEFHQFADRQVHAADMREAAIEREVKARLAWAEATPAPEQPEDMSLDEVNRRLAAEAGARRAAKPRQEEHTKIG
jgi:hypothetical protein